METRGLSICTKSLVLVVVLFTWVPALAYVDPGTGSYVFQLVLAGSMAAVFALKTYWRKLRDLLRKALGFREDQPR